MSCAFPGERCGSDMSCTFQRTKGAKSGTSCAFLQERRKSCAFHCSFKGERCDSDMRHELRISTRKAQLRVAPFKEKGATLSELCLSRRKLRLGHELRLSRRKVWLGHELHLSMRMVQLRHELRLSSRKVQVVWVAPFKEKCASRTRVAPFKEKGLTRTQVAPFKDKGATRSEMRLSRRKVQLKLVSKMKNSISISLKTFL
jgi:hypothetical protein